MGRAAVGLGAPLRTPGGQQRPRAPRADRTVRLRPLGSSSALRLLGATSPGLPALVTCTATGEVESEPAARRIALPLAVAGLTLGGSATAASAASAARLRLSAIRSTRASPLKKLSKEFFIARGSSGAATALRHASRRCLRRMVAGKQLPSGRQAHKHARRAPGPPSTTVPGGFAHAARGEQGRQAAANG
jgi:hypothetical protein